MYVCTQSRAFAFENEREAYIPAYPCALSVSVCSPSTHGYLSLYTTTPWGGTGRDRYRMQPVCAHMWKPYEKGLPCANKKREKVCVCVGHDVAERMYWGGPSLVKVSEEKAVRRVRGRKLNM